MEVLGGDGLFPGFGGGLIQHNRTVDGELA